MVKYRKSRKPRRRSVTLTLRVEPPTFPVEVRMIIPVEAMLVALAEYRKYPVGVGPGTATHPVKAPLPSGGRLDAEYCQYWTFWSRRWM